MMNKMAKIGLALLAVLLIGSFIGIAIMDVPVKQTEITKTISNERFFKDN